MTFEQLQKELQQSMKDKNRIRKNVIADMVTCAKNMAIEQGCKDNITEEIVDAAILKSKKICQEQIDTCPAQRPDILEGYNLCMSYINELAPKMMTEDEVRKYIEDELIEMTQVYTLSPKIKGLVMKNIMPNLKGKADGKLINKIVTELLEKNNNE
jgi:hypothetical protein